MKSLSLSFIMLFFACTTSFPQQETTGAVYVFESGVNGFNTKTFFYDDGKEVIAFDAQFTEAIAQQAIDFLKSKTNNPIKYLVVTHPNPDKFNGIPAFQKVGAQVIMSKLSGDNLAGVHNYKKYYFVSIAKMFTEDTYPQLPSADIIFDKEYKIKLANGGIVNLTELKQKGVSTNQTIAFIPAANALIVGDLVHHNAHAWLEGPIVNGKAIYDTINWINTLQEIQHQFPEDSSIYGGRGASGKVKDVIQQQIAYLGKALVISKKYLVSVNNDVSKVDYNALQKIFEKEFPTYNLGYMIAYGAYGIIESVKEK
jgi:glyoxylase-like metal-dependent hydrolase (beta-lactamase superfamily II)